MKKRIFLTSLALLVLIFTIIIIIKIRKTESKSIVGGVVPHHLLAKQMIEDFFNRLAKQNPSTIILLGPNHFEKGSAVLSSLENWQMNNGLLQSDQLLIVKLQKENLLALDEEVLKEENSISDVIPIIKKYLPETKVVPIIFRRSVGLKQAQKIANGILSFLNKEKVVIVASVDFSHYLSQDKAQIKDGETLMAIKNSDLPKILSFGSDHLDSPASLAVLLLLMQGRRMQVVEYSNSAMILKRGDLPVTSYLEIMFD